MERTTYAIGIAILAVIIAVLYFRKTAAATAAAPVALPKSYTMSGYQGGGTAGTYNIIPMVTGSAFKAPIFLQNTSTGNVAYPSYYLIIRRADGSYVSSMADVPAALAAAGTMVNTPAGIDSGEQGWGWQLVSTLTLTPNY